jgi:O-antigen/teichoic acid export membrane protein
MLLNLLAISSIFISINSVFGSLFRVKHKIKELIIISIISAVSTLGLTYLWIDHGLIGIGLAWLIGQGITTIVYVVGWLWGKRKNS